MTTDHTRALLTTLSQAHEHADALAGELHGVEHSAALDVRMEIALLMRKARGLALVSGRMTPAEVEVVER